MSDFASKILDAIGGNDPDATVDSWLDTGYPPLNKAISGFYRGGFPNGRIVEIFGLESSGKTAIATNAMISAQRAGGVAGFNDHERSFDAELAQANGLNIADRWIYKKPKSFEQSVSLASKIMHLIRSSKICPDDAPIALVFDSLAMMIPQSKLEKGAEETNMHDTTALARATSSALPALSATCEETNTLAIFLNQIREKPGVSFGDPTTTPGGKTMQFVASVRIKLSRKQLFKVVNGKKVITGQTITANIVKNKVSAPFKTVQWDFMFRDDGTGYLDSIGGTLDYMVEEGLFAMDGKRFDINGKKLYKAQAVLEVEALGGIEYLLVMLDKHESKSA